MYVYIERRRGRGRGRKRGGEGGGEERERERERESMFIPSHPPHFSLSLHIQDEEDFGREVTARINFFGSGPTTIPSSRVTFYIPDDVDMTGDSYYLYPARVRYLTLSFLYIYICTCNVICCLATGVYLLDVARQRACICWMLLDNGPVLGPVFCGVSLIVNLFTLCTSYQGWEYICDRPSCKACVVHPDSTKIVISNF